MVSLTSRTDALVPEFFPLPNESYRTFPRGVVATSHTPLGGDFLLTETVLSPTYFSEERLS